MHALSQRHKDGYINATAVCQANGKEIKHYLTNDTTQAFLQALSRSTGIPADLLVVTIRTGSNSTRGTWVHPKAAVHLAMWCSADFALAVSEWVYEWMSGRQLDTEALCREYLAVVDARRAED